MSVPESQADASPASRGRFQVGIRFLFWLTAAIAVWMTVSINARENASLSGRLEGLRNIARELVVDDPTKYAGVKLHDLWNDEQRWDVYLPPGRYRVRLATRDIDKDGLPEASWSAPIEPGRHRIGLNLMTGASGSRMDVLVDGTRLLHVDEAKDWDTSGWTSQNDLSTSEQRPADRRLEILRRRNLRREAAGRFSDEPEPSTGLLLWIERTDVPENPTSK